MNPDDIIKLHQDVLRLFAHAMEAQQEIARLKARVAELEHQNDIEEITGLREGVMSR